MYTTIAQRNEYNDQPEVNNPLTSQSFNPCYLIQQSMNTTLETDIQQIKKDGLDIHLSSQDYVTYRSQYSNIEWILAD